MKSVLLGMSGGVDSSAAAYILKEQGYNVIGATMLLRDGMDCSDARKVCEHLDIEFRELDFREEFSKQVIDYFVDEYIHGRTPNPCIMCNKFLKFGKMFEYAKENGIDYVATGHYAKVERDGEKYILRTADTLRKDQSYVLYNLTQEQLSRTLFPLGGYEKEEIRKIAENVGIDVANKPESQEICFVEDNNYARFIKEYSGYVPQEGDFLDVNGSIMGTHRGIIYYTVGQRKGIGAFGRPMFVMKINPDNNTVILGEKGMEYSNTLTAREVNFISGEYPDETINAQARIRYQSQPSPAKIIYLGDGRVQVEFEEPQRAVTPGQSVVFYDGDIVLGGGIIE